MSNKYSAIITQEVFKNMFYQISDYLKETNSKIPWTSWSAMRGVAINKKSCDCFSYDEPRINKVKVELDGSEFTVSCGFCGEELAGVRHQPFVDAAATFLARLEELVGSKKEEFVDTVKEKKYNNNIENKKNIKGEEENDNMMNTNKMIKGFDFGKADSKDFRLSHLGLAIKNKEGVFVSYDANNDELVDVDIFDFNLDGMIYKMPVAHKDVKPSDVILHNGTAMVVQEVKANKLDVIDPVGGEIKTIMPTKSMFGFNFFTKVLCLMDMSNANASSDNPFGNMMPMLMMSSMSQGKGGNDDMVKMMMMSQMMGGKQMGDMFSNPMMMMAMMGSEGGMNDMLPMMMMMNGGMLNQQQAPVMDDKDKLIAELKAEINGMKETGLID